MSNPTMVARSVAAPPPVLPKEDESALTKRQQEILTELETIFAKGFTNVTMGELATQLGCSLRTLYGLAPSRDQLVLVVVDRQLRNIGRNAHAAITEDLTHLEAIRAYLTAANRAVNNTTKEFAADIESLEAGRALNRSHSDYIIAVTKALLDAAIRTKEISKVNTAAVARVLAGVGADFAQASVIPTLGTNPADAANSVTDIVLAGLTAQDN